MIEATQRTWVEGMRRRRNRARLLAIREANAVWLSEGLHGLSREDVPNLELVIREAARVRTTLLADSRYLGDYGWLLIPEGRGAQRQWIRACLRPCRTPKEVRRVMETWRRVHYLGDPDRAENPHWRVFKPNAYLLHFILDLPAMRLPPQPWVPAAAATVRYALMGGLPAEVFREIDSPLQCLELARLFTADDLGERPDFTPTVVRELVRRLQTTRDWLDKIEGHIGVKPTWFFAYSDLSVGHNGNIYRDSGAVQMYVNESTGRVLWGWRLDQARAVAS